MKSWGYVTAVLHARLLVCIHMIAIILTAASAAELSRFAYDTKIAQCNSN